MELDPSNDYLLLAKAFIQNIALFIVLSFILGRISDRITPGKGWRWHVSATLLFSTGAIVSMAIPFEPVPGVLLDQRNVILLFSAPFGGPYAAIGAGIVTALARLYVGGFGAYAGAGAAISSVLLSLYFMNHLGRLESKRSAILGGLLLGFGCNLPWALVFPNPAVGGDLALKFVGPFLFFYTIGPASLTVILMVHRKRLIAEAALAKSQQTLQDVLDISTDWFWEIDKDLRFTFLSQSFSQVFSRDPSYYIGKRRSDLAVPENLQEVLDYEEMLRRHEPFTHFRYRLNSADGEERHVSISGKPIWDEEGAFAGYRGSGREVTTEVAAETKLRDALADAEAANRAKSLFLSQMSHELRTPLNAIIGFADMMRHQIRGPIANSAYREDAEHIYTSGHHLLDLINQLLDLSRIDAGKVELELVDCEPISIVDWVANLMAPQAKAAGLTWEVKDNAPGVRGNLDERAMRQILLNLVGNAIKFTPSGGHVEIVMERWDDGGLRLSVIDTGMGIPEAELADMLKPFERASNAATGALEGTGLGLAICKAMIEEHGGELRIASTLGEGTRVDVLLPPCSDDRAIGIIAA